jgi:cation:H+ antiporter
VVDRDFYKVNWPVMMLFSFLLYFFLGSGGNLSRLEGFALLLIMFIYLFFLIRHARKSHVEVEGIDESLSKISNFKIGAWLIIGGFALWAGSELLVSGAVDLAGWLGVSERVISITIIAIGTSVPELAASVIAALKQEKALSMGNLIGSNIFNIASVLGITSIIQPIYLNSTAILTNDIFWMIGFAFILIPMTFIPKKFIFSRYKGAILFVSYVIFIGMAFLN